MSGRLWSSTAFWLGAVALAALTNLVIWWPQLRPVLRGDCAELRTMLMTDAATREQVRVWLGPPTLEATSSWEYAQLCVDAGSGMTADVAILFRAGNVLQVVY